MKKHLLSASLLAICASVQGQTVTEVIINDEKCEPMHLTVPSGKNVFKIINKGTRELEWEILDGAMMINEKEGIEPNQTAELQQTLLAGEYTTVCGLFLNERGKLTVTDSGYQPSNDEKALAELKKPLEEYKSYVRAEAKLLGEKTAKFVEAVKANKIDEAKALYAPTRFHYERIEPIAELFSWLDPAIDARADDFKLEEKDPEFKGFHRLEYGLWVENQTDHLHAVADELLKNVGELEKSVELLVFPVSNVVGGSAVLIEEVANSKISGEENRYSGTDLSDFQANMEGSQKIVELFRPYIQAKNEALLKVIDEKTAEVFEILSKYQKDGVFADYKTLSEDDRKKLQVPINVLAEELAKLRGVLGVD